MQIVICYFRRRLIWSLNHFPDAKSCILDEREIITHFIDGVFFVVIQFLIYNSIGLRLWIYAHFN